MSIATKKKLLTAEGFFLLMEYFAKGVRLVWVIAPEDRMLTI